MALIKAKSLPAVLIERAEIAARGWRFEPPMHAGQPVGGTTIARMAICVLPVGDRIQIYVNYRGNGPRHSSAAAPPSLPVASVRELMGQGTRQVSAMFRYRVNPDGTGTLESTAFTDPSIERRHGSAEWTKRMAKWVAAGRFEPETIGGVAVSTQVEERLDLMWAANGERFPRDLALGDSQGCDTPPAGPLVLDSPFKRLPEG